MKNIHLLPTDKPSRLVINWEKDLCYKSKPYLMEGTQNIYITSDEEIKFEDYITDGYLFWKWKDDSSLLGRKKIILTTDQDLIKDGVQAIDDDFLEWFIKNPSCERVEISKIEDELISPKNPKIRFNALQDPPSFISAELLNNMILTYKYKIIIPKTTQQVIDEDFAGGLEMGQIISKEERSYSEEEVYHILCEHTAELFKGSKMTLTEWFNKFKKK